MKIRRFLGCLILFAAMIGLLSACGDGKTSSEADSAAKKTEIDIDLTQMSSTMVYSEVYNIVTEPDEYMGKMIKMEGTFSLYHDDATGEDYYACIIEDATACCSQGIEFELSDDYKYPGDYMTEGDTITVAGVFDQYKEGDYIYYTLRDAELL